MAKQKTLTKGLKEGTSRSGATKRRPHSRQMAKVTLYVRMDQVIAIEEIQMEERRRTGLRPDKSTLIQEALDLLAKKYGI